MGLSVRFALRLSRRKVGVYLLLATIVALPAVLGTVVSTGAVSTVENPTVYVASKVASDSTTRVDFARTTAVRQDVAGSRAERVDADGEASAATVGLADYEKAIVGAFGLKEPPTLAVATLASLRTSALATDPLSTLVTGAQSELLPYSMTGTWPTNTTEVALSRDTAKRLDVSLGDRVTIADSEDGADARIVGIFDSQDGVKVLLSADVTKQLVPDFGDDPRGYSWLFEAPDTATWSQAAQMNTMGATVSTASLLRETPPADVLPSANTELVAWFVAVASAVIGGLLLVPAFTLTTSRVRRDLALLSASGASRGQLVAIQSLIGAAVGFVGASIGLLLGLGVAALLKLLGLLPGMAGFVVPITPLTFLVLACTFTAVLASAAAASIATRGLFAVAIADRATPRGPRAARLRWTILAAGLSLAVLGVATGANLIVGGGVFLAMIGLIAVTSPVLATLSRHSSGFPLSARLALRDAARHPRRSVPFVIVLVALSAAVAGGATYSVSASASEQAQYHAILPFGSISVDISMTPTGNAAATSKRTESLTKSISTILSPASTTVMTALAEPPGVDTKGDPSLLLGTDDASRYVSLDTVVISDGSDAQLLGFDHPQELADALSSGHVAVSNADLISKDGTISIKTDSGAVQKVPAKVISVPEGVFAIAATPSLVDKLGLTTVPVRIVALPSADVTFSTKQLDSVRSIATATLAPDSVVTAHLELGSQPSTSVQALRAMSLGVAILAAILTWIMTLLAAREQRQEARVITAVGATPATITSMSAIQGATLSAVGVIVGLTGGTVLVALVITGFAKSDSTWKVTVPWLVLLLIAFLGPALSAGVGALTSVTRSRRHSREPALRD